LPDRHPVYDAVQRRLVDGYALVSACVVGPGRRWPIGLLPHQPPPGAKTRRRRKAAAGEAPSKLDLALQLIQLAVAAGVGAPTVVGDGAFAVQWWLREIAALGRHWLVSTRVDRRLRIGTEIRAIATWVQTLPLAPRAISPDAPGIYGALLPPAVLLDKGCRQQGLPCRPAYFERRDRRGRVTHRWYLVTSQLDWDLATLWQHWQWRWAIEVFHRDSKQHLHLEAFHVRTWAGITALVACSSLRASLLAFLQAVDPTCAALSTEALVAALREAAVVVQPGADGSHCVWPPARLPADQLWRIGQPALPGHWLRLQQEAA
jgi:hypothetical protein